MLLYVHNSIVCKDFDYNFVCGLKSVHATIMISVTNATLRIYFKDGIFNLFMGPFHCYSLSMGTVKLKLVDIVHTYTFFLT